MHDRNKAQYWIERLRLEPHPEGGHYKEVYKANETIFKTNLPKRYQGDRAFSTSIYFLLQKNEFSAFHRLKSDETWYFHGGDPIELLIIDHRGILEKMVIGFGDHALPQFTIRNGNWFAAKTTGEFTLLGCNVAPGFDFADFEMASFDKLSKEYPQHEKMIREYTY